MANFNDNASRRIAAQTRRLEKTPATALELPGPAGPPGRPSVSFGMPTAAFSSGTTITLNPTDSAGNDLPNLDDVICHLAPDASSVSYPFGTSAILRFARYPVLTSSGVGGVLLGITSSAASVTGFDLWVDVQSDSALKSGTVTLDDSIDWRGYFLPCWLSSIWSVGDIDPTTGDGMSWFSADVTGDPQWVGQGGSSGSTAGSESTIWYDENNLPCTVYVYVANDGKVKMYVGPGHGARWQIRVRVGQPPLVRKTITTGPDKTLILS